MTNPTIQIKKTQVVTYRVPYADLGKLVGASEGSKVTSAFVTVPYLNTLGQAGSSVPYTPVNPELIVTVEEPA